MTAIDNQLLLTVTNSQHDYDCRLKAEFLLALAGTMILGSQFHGTHERI
jgi:hypothetical protein